MITVNFTLSFAAAALANTNIKSGFTENSVGNKPFSMDISFATHGLEISNEHAINAGATPGAPAQVKPHGQTVTYAANIDGFVVEVCTPMG